jgi:hypothetical protein
MLKRYIHQVATVFPDPAREGDAMAPLVAALPPRVVRRMSRLGILLNHVLKGMPVGVDSTLIYATTFTETGALETYLRSFPYASPTAFQTSIHPGGVEQALILDQREVGTFIPLAGKDTLVASALQCALLSDSEDVVLCGGEEAGTWLRDYALSYPVSYAYAIHLSIREEGSLGCITWSATEGCTQDKLPAADLFAARMKAAEDMILGDRWVGRFAVTWA